MTRIPVLASTVTISITPMEILHLDSRTAVETLPNDKTGLGNERYGVFFCRTAHFGKENNLRSSNEHFDIKILSHYQIVSVVVARIN